METPKLTHTEACKMVEDALERVEKTLAYVRLKLDCNQPKDDTLPGIGECSEWRIKGLVEEANLLCNINWYGAYLKGAIAMALALQDWDLLDFSLKKAGHGGYSKISVKRADRIVNKAVFDLFLSSTRNLEYCLHGLPDGIEIFTDIERDKKGKIKAAKAKFVKKQTTYKEI